MSRYARKFSEVLHLHVKARGDVPVTGLVVSNHLGYLDILALGSVLPGVFVSKSEVRSWPLLGALARSAGTVFVNRKSSSGLKGELSSMDQAIHLALPVILFPEGTSSGGESVLPFRSSLFQAAATAGRATPASLEYRLTEGSVSEEVCYWKDMTLLPHLWNLFGKANIFVTVSFGTPMDTRINRKELTKTLHQAVCQLHTQNKTLEFVLE